MIRIHRTPTAPAKLRQKGSRQTEIDCAAYDAAPAGYIAHTESFPTKNYYKWKDVKDALMRMHREKCCYCETKLYGAPTSMWSTSDRKQKYAKVVLAIVSILGITGWHIAGRICYWRVLFVT